MTFQRTNISLKVHGNPTREELRDTEVSVQSGMSHCKQPCGLPAKCFSDARTPDAVLQTTLKQVQEATLKQEMKLSQNALLSLTQGFCHPDDVTDLGDIISSPLSLSGACLSGWWVSGWLVGVWLAGVQAQGTEGTCILCCQEPWSEAPSRCHPQ